ncbi:MAG: ABC transporter ATP-binding protein [bacterium]
MASLAVKSLTKRFGTVMALDNVTLTIAPGEFVTLLGPSGCGKTTFLRVVAGLEKPESGEILLEDKCINDVPLNHREMGMVVQNYALFPHMRVFGNVAYGLRVRRIPANDLRQRVIEALKLVRLTGFEDRYPNQLSGGQQQRCAIARALVIQPRILLLDEALGALDKNLREEMQVELKQIQQRLGVTTLHVTHDQEEALGMSDRIVVLNQGRVEQFGTPLDLYEKPQTEFVANFIGDANIFKGHVIDRKPDGRLTVNSEEGFDIDISVDDDFLPKSRIIFVIRPERMVIERNRPKDPINAFQGTIEAVVYHGNATKVVIRLENDRRLLVHEPCASDHGGEYQRQSGESVWVTWPFNAARVVTA